MKREYEYVSENISNIETKLSNILDIEAKVKEINSQQSVA